MKASYLVQKPVVEMRLSPDPRSEVVSQLFYSEAVSIISEAGDWVDVISDIDQYRGWMKKEALVSSTKVEATPYCIVNRLAAHVYTEQDTIYGPILTLPFESKLKVLAKDISSASRWLSVSLVDGRNGFIQRGDVSTDDSCINIDDMCLLSRSFLGIPYTWGGRSSFGYDCSGFVQMLYRRMGILLPRDSSMQSLWHGFREIPLNGVTKGDLIFFGHNPQQIRHVGLSLGGDRFIHTCAVVEQMPYVRESSLSDAEWNGSGYYPFITARTLI